MTSNFSVGDWMVFPDTGTIQSVEQQIQLEPRVMDVLVHFSRQASKVLSKERLIGASWPEAFVTDYVLTSAIWKLRQALGDDPKHPTYIKTIPRRGYQLIAEVQHPKPVSAQKGSLLKIQRIGGPVLVGIILVFSVSRWILDGGISRFRRNDDRLFSNSYPIKPIDHRDDQSETALTLRQSTVR